MRKAAHAEIHVARRLVRVARIDELLHKIDHLGNFLGGLGADIRIHHAGRVHIVDERLRVFGCHFRCRPALFIGLVDDLVIHVGDVLHELHLEAAPRQIAANDIEGYERARVADMNVVVHRGPADIHAHFAQFDGIEIFLGARLRVVDSNHGASLRMVVTRTI